MKGRGYGQPVLGMREVSKPSAASVFHLVSWLYGPGRPDGGLFRLQSNLAALCRGLFRGRSLCSLRTPWRFVPGLFWHVQRVGLKRAASKPASSCAGQLPRVWTEQRGGLILRGLCN